MLQAEKPLELIANLVTYLCAWPHYSTNETKIYPNNLAKFMGCYPLFELDENVLDICVVLLLLLLSWTPSILRKEKSIPKVGI